jgi:hypothetical protein
MFNTRRSSQEAALVVESAFCNGLCRAALCTILRKSRPVGYGMIGRTSSQRCAHPHELHRTLRDGPLRVAVSQALRARLRSVVPPGQRPFPSQSRLIFVPFSYRSDRSMGRRLGAFAIGHVRLSSIFVMRRILICACTHRIVAYEISVFTLVFDWLRR